MDFMIVNEICFSLVGAILFGINSDDLADELRELMCELNKGKVALWKQMHIIEITAAELADLLAQGGTKFEMEPDRVIWPDGTITKKKFLLLDPENPKKFLQLLANIGCMVS